MKPSMALFQFRDRTLSYSLYPSPTLLDILICLPQEELVSPVTWEQVFSGPTFSGPKGRVCMMEAWSEPMDPSQRHLFLVEMFDALSLTPKVLIVNPVAMSRIASELEYLIAPLKGLVVVKPSPMSWDEELRPWRNQLRRECPILLIETIVDGGKSSSAGKDFDRQWSQVSRVFFETAKRTEISTPVLQFLLDLN